MRGARCEVGWWDLCVHTHRVTTVALSSCSLDTHSHTIPEGTSTHISVRGIQARTNRSVVMSDGIRNSVRGIETQVFNHVWRASTSQEWASWLRLPLESAASQGDLGVAQKLVEAGAEIGIAVHEAIWGRHEDVAECLLGISPASVANKDEKKRAPLHIAALIGSKSMVRLLLLKGADVEAVDEKGKTPIFKATQHGKVSVVRALLDAGASVSIRSTCDDASPLDWAASEGCVRLLGVLIEHGVEVDSASSIGRTALHHAADNNQVGAIDVLVAAGADIDAYTDDPSEFYDSVTPLLCAAAEWNVEALRRLVQHGACVNSSDMYGSSLHHVVRRAGRHGTAEIVDLLLRSGADETVTDIDKETPADTIEYKAKQKDRDGGLLAENEDFNRVRQLLANAPADRTWRRRGFLVLCRAHPNRVHLLTGMAPRTRSRARLAETTAGRVDPQIPGSNEPVRGGSWPGVVAKLLGLAEEDVFRKIVRYL